MLFFPFFLAGIVDHIDAERRTNSAARTVRAAAVLRERRCECLLPLRFQIAFEYAGRGVRPRQRFTDRARAAAVIRPVDAAIHKCGEIVCIVEEIRPPVKLCPAFPCGVQRWRKAPVTARKDPLDHGEPCIVIVERDGTIRDMLLQELLTPLKLLNRELPEPLKRRIRFRHEAGDRDGDLAPAPSANLRIEIDDLLREAGDPDDVLIRLRRQPHHKVELHLLPPVAECRPARREQILLRHPFIDDVAQTLRPRLRREGQPGLAHALYLLGELHGKTVNAQRRKGDADLLVPIVLDEIIHKTAKPRIVRRGERGQAHLIVAAGGNHLMCHLPQAFLRALTRGTIGNACLTEAAAARAAAKELKHGTVVYDVHVGDDGMLCRDSIVHVLHHALVDHGARIGVKRIHAHEIPSCIVDGHIERRHIDPIHTEQLGQEPASSARSARCIPPNKGVADLGQYLLPLADDEEVEEARYRLDIVNAWAAADDERHILTALLRIQRNARQIEHIQHIRVDHLVLERETNEVKCTNSVARFQ